MEAKPADPVMVIKDPLDVFFRSFRDAVTDQPPSAAGIVARACLKEAERQLLENGATALHLQLAKVLLHEQIELERKVVKCVASVDAVTSSIQAQTQTSAKVEVSPPEEVRTPPVQKAPATKRRWFHRFDGWYLGLVAIAAGLAAYLMSLDGTMVEITINYDVAGIIAAILGGGGIAAAGVAYAIKTLRESPPAE